MSEACLEKTTHSDSQRYREPLRQSRYIATTTEAIKNYKENWAGVWFRENVDASDPGGNFAFQRLRHTWFTPRITPKFRLRRDDKFYAIGSCFVRGLESALKMHKVAVESAAPEFARLQPAKKEISPLGFLNKYNTYSIMNELRWATTWDDPHTTPILEFADLEETDVFINRTPIPSLLNTEPDRYEFHLTGFAQNLANLEAIHALLTQYGHPEVHIVVTVSPIALMNTFSTMDIVVANTWAKSMLRAVAHEWAATHSNVDYYPSYEIVQNSDRAAVWENDLRHVKGAGAQHVLELFLQKYLES